MTDRVTHSPSPEVDDITLRLTLAAVGACTCLTKAPQIEAHEPSCLYRVLMEAEAEIVALRR